MVTYVRVSDDIAERVASGALAAGDELPSVREAACRYGTTTTAARAYRRLAGAGVIDSADRRRSRVATAGEHAARRLLGEVPSSGSHELRLAGSDDPGLDLVLRFAGNAQARCSWFGLRYLL